MTGRFFVEMSVKEVLYRILDRGLEATNGRYVHTGSGLTGKEMTSIVLSSFPLVTGDGTSRAGQGQRSPDAQVSPPNYPPGFDSGYERGGALTQKWGFATSLQARVIRQYYDKPFLKRDMKGCQPVPPG